MPVNVGLTEEERDVLLGGPGKVIPGFNLYRADKCVAWCCPDVTGLAFNERATEMWKFAAAGKSAGLWGTIILEIPSDPASI